MLQAGLEQRVARLEGRVQGFHGRFEGLERRLDRIERRFDALDAKVDRLGAEMGARIEAFRTQLSDRVEALDQKVSRHFTWTVGIQVAVLLAVVAALAGR